MMTEIRIIGETKEATRAMAADLLLMLHQRHGDALRAEFGPPRACGRQRTGETRRYRIYMTVEIDVARRARDAAQQAETTPGRAGR